MKGRNKAREERLDEKETREEEREKKATETERERKERERADAPTHQRPLFFAQELEINITSVS